jgi:hypothetical protein
VRPRPRGATVDAALEGGLREDTVEVQLEGWIVAQLLGDYRLVLDWQVQRPLTGVAKRPCTTSAPAAMTSPNARGRMKSNSTSRSPTR